MTEGHKRTVLVVDDANGLVEIYERWLNDDFRVLTATDGQTAISTADDGVDVVLIDRNLPKMSGSTVVEEIRNLGHDPSVVLLSSVEPDFDVIDVDFEACLTKPVMRRDLVDAVERAAAGDGPDSAGSERSGPTLADHAPDHGADDDGAPGDAGDDPEDVDGTQGGEPPEGTGGAAGATTGESTDGEPDDEEEETDVTARLQSLQSDLEATADELSARADDRRNAGADDGDGLDDEGGSTDATGSPFDEWEGAPEPDEAESAATEDAETTGAEEVESAEAEGAETTGADAETARDGTDDGGAPPGEAADPDDADRTGDDRSPGGEDPDRGESGAGTPRDLLPDADEDEEEDRDAESLQRRVERLASKATELAEGTVEDADEEPEDD